jgi:phage shock protein A
MRRWLQRIKARWAWSLLRAAEFDTIANELLDQVETLRDPAAVIQRKYAELEGRQQRLEKEMLRLEVAVRENAHDLETVIRERNRPSA